MLCVISNSNRLCQLHGDRRPYHGPHEVIGVRRHTLPFKVSLHSSTGCSAVYPLQRNCFPERVNLVGSRTIHAASSGRDTNPERHDTCLIATLWDRQLRIPCACSKKRPHSCTPSVAIRITSCLLVGVPTVVMGSEQPQVVRITNRSGLGRLVV